MVDRQRCEDLSLQVDEMMLDVGEVSRELDDVRAACENRLALLKREEIVARQLAEKQIAELQAEVKALRQELQARSRPLSSARSSVSRTSARSSRECVPGLCRRMNCTCQGDRVVSARHAGNASATFKRLPSYCHVPGCFVYFCSAGVTFPREKATCLITACGMPPG